MSIRSYMELGVRDSERNLADLQRLPRDEGGAG